MFYSCTDMTTAGVKGLNSRRIRLISGCGVLYLARKLIQFVAGACALLR